MISGFNQPFSCPAVPLFSRVEQNLLLAKAPVGIFLPLDLVAKKEKENQPEPDL